MSILTSTENKQVIASRRIDGHSARVGGGARSDSAQNVLAIDQISATGAEQASIITSHERRYFCGFIPPNSTDYAHAKIGDIYDEFTADSAESSQPHDFTRWCYTAAGWEKMTKRAHVRYGQNYGDGTTRYDVTSQGSNVFRYAWDSTGTDPNFEANNLKVGDKVVISDGFATANEGTFAVIALTDNYIEIVNADGSAEADVVCGTAIKSYDTLDAVIDDVYLANYTTGITVVPFTAVGCAGRVITIKNLSTGTITVNPYASETIDGSSTVLLNEANAFVTLMSDGANWRIIGTNESSISVSVSNTVVTKTGDYTTTYADDTVIANKGSAIAIELGTAACVSGKIQRVKNKGAGACTVSTEGSETIDGAATLVLSKQYDEATFQSDGTNWYVIEKNIGDHSTQDIVTTGTLTVGTTLTVGSTITSGGNIVSNTNSGVSLGSDTNQKVGFHALASAIRTKINDPGTTGASLQTAINSIIDSLEAFGLNKSS